MPKSIVRFRDLSMNTFGIRVPGLNLNGTPYYAVMLKDKARKSWRECLNDAITYYQEQLKTANASPGSYFRDQQIIYSASVRYLQALKA